jgi:hypothetical protein
MGGRLAVELLLAGPRVEVADGRAVFGLGEVLALQRVSDGRVQVRLAEENDVAVPQVLPAERRRVLEADVPPEQPPVEVAPGNPEEVKNQLF